MSEATNQPPIPEDSTDRPRLPVLGACGCGPGCRCGCQSGGPCSCGGSCR